MIMLNCDCHSQSNFIGTTISFNVYSLHFYAAKLSCCRNFTFLLKISQVFLMIHNVSLLVCMFVFSVISHN